MTEKKRIKRITCYLAGSHEEIDEMEHTIAGLMFVANLSEHAALAAAIRKGLDCVNRA